MPIQIFISHSSGDKDLVACFVRALDAALAISDDAIRCTSLPGYRLRSGSHTSTALRKEIAEATLIVGVLTPASLESGWVMFELGSAWGTNKWVVPLLAGIDYDSLPGPLKECNATDASSRAELEQLIQEIATTLQLKTRPAGRATGALDELVAEAETYEDDEGEEDEEEDEGEQHSDDDSDADRPDEGPRKGSRR